MEGQNNEERESLEGLDNKEILENMGNPTVLGSLDGINLSDYAEWLDKYDVTMDGKL